MSISDHIVVLDHGIVIAEGADAIRNDPKVIAAYLGDRGLLLRQGTVVDATIIHAPSSTKKKDGKRDPEMHQTKKGNQYYFGMKSHIGVDAESGLVHSLNGTAANVADVT
jgi:transposase, IS5 family